MDLTAIEPFYEVIRIVLTVVIILAATYVVASIVKRLLNRSFNKSARFLKVDPTHYTFLKHVMTGVIYAVGIGIAIYTVPSLRSLSMSLLAGAGILAVVVGFASQQAFSNIVSGIFIAIFKPFRVGDRISIGTSISGVVEDINLRHTVIRNFENKRLIIPNAIISDETIENSSVVDEKICRWVDIGISYDSDINKAMRIMQREAMKHPDFLDNRTDEEKEDKVPAVTVRVIGFGDSSVNLRAWVWAPDPAAAFRLGTDLNKSIKESFDKEGVEIPYPYRTIVQKKSTGKRK